MKNHHNSKHNMKGWPMHYAASWDCLHCSYNGLHPSSVDHRVGLWHIWNVCSKWGLFRLPLQRLSPLLCSRCCRHCAMPRVIDMFWVVCSKLESFRLQLQWLLPILCVSCGWASLCSATCLWHAWVVTSIQPFWTSVLTMLTVLTVPAFDAASWNRPDCSYNGFHPSCVYDAVGAMPLAPWGKTHQCSSSRFAWGKVTQHWQLLCVPRKESLYRTALTQRHHCSQNAVIGSLLHCCYIENVFTSSVQKRGYCTRSLAEHAVLLAGCKTA